MDYRCDCNRKAEFLVFAQLEPHCLECMMDAIDCTVQTPVMTIEAWERKQREQRISVVA